VALKLFRPRETTPRLERLRGLSLFVDLTPAELAIVDAQLHEREYIKGEVIFDEGEDGQGIYFVLEGAVSITRKAPNGIDRFKIVDLGVGAVFGDIALLDNAPRVGQAVAAGDCVLAVFFRGDFMGLLDTHARIASKISLQMARAMARRLRDARESTVVSAESDQHL